MQNHVGADSREMGMELTRMMSHVVAMSAGCGIAVSAILIGLAALVG